MFQVMNKQPFPLASRVCYLDTAAEGIPPAASEAALLSYWQDKSRGIEGRRPALGNHRRQGLADIAHAVARQARVRRHDHRAAVAAVQGDGAGQIAVAGLVELGLGQDQMHAGCRPRRRDVDAAQDAVRMGRADELGEQQAGEIPVGAVAALAAQQPRILLARDRLRDAELGRSGADHIHA